MILVSIIIVSFNARADLVACLGSLSQTPPAVEHEILVVDNASSDGSVEAARGFGGWLARSPRRNAGFAAANNAGIRASRGNLLLLLNSVMARCAGRRDRPTPAGLLRRAGRAVAGAPTDRWSGTRSSCGLLNELLEIARAPTASPERFGERSAPARPSRWSAASTSDFSYTEHVDSPAPLFRPLASTGRPSPRTFTRRYRRRPKPRRSPDGWRLREAPSRNGAPALCAQGGVAR